MVIKRKVSRNKYVIALLITFAVFALGLLLGLVIESGRLQVIESQKTKQTLDFNSLQLQYQFIDIFGEEKNCNALKKTFEESIQNLENTRKKLEDYLEDSRLNKDQFNLLKREYSLAQIRFWLLTKKTKDICGLEHSIVFYFYADDAQCAKCGDQAYVLTHLKNKFGINLLNFAFDAQFEDEPLIGILTETLGIERYPSLIINGEKFAGFTSEETILKEICPTYKNVENELCKEYQIIRIS